MNAKDEKRLERARVKVEETGALVAELRAARNELKTQTDDAQARVRAALPAFDDARAKLRKLEVELGLAGTGPTQQIGG